MGSVCGTHSLPEGLRRAWERACGVDLGDVVVHNDSGLPELLGAVGLAWGRHIFLAPGAGEYLRHELVHVIQQRQGRVPGGGLAEDPALEAEAMRERPPGRRVGRVEPTPALQCCRLCGDDDCTEGELCGLAGYLDKPNVQQAVARVQAIDPSFVSEVFGSQGWNSGIGRPAEIRPVWAKIQRDHAGGFQCPYCQRQRTRADLHVDHHIPWKLYLQRTLGITDRSFGLPVFVARVLASDPDNLVALCGSCNESKGDRDPDDPSFSDWVASRRQLAADGGLAAVAAPPHRPPRPPIDWAAERAARERAEEEERRQHQAEREARYQRFASRRWQGGGGGM